MGKNDYNTEPRVHVSATISHEFWNKLRELQKKGVENSGWSDVMRRGALLIFDCAEGKDPYDKIKRLIQQLAETAKQNPVPAPTKYNDQSGPGGT